jgi:hypothetical protein
MLAIELKERASLDSTMEAVGGIVGPPLPALGKGLATAWQESRPLR